MFRPQIRQAGCLVDPPFAVRAAHYLGEYRERRMIEALMLLLGAVLLMRRAPDLPLARLLHDWLAVRPARWLLRRSPQELIAWAIVAAVIVFAGEYVLIIGGPQIAIGVAVDLAAYVDAVIAAVTLASAVRMQAIAKWVVPRSRRPSRPRSPRSRRIRPERPAANDSDDRPARLAA